MTDLEEQVRKVLDTLGETDPAPQKQVERALALLGTDRIEAVLNEAVQIEAGGGMLITSGERRRTLGGVFFKLLKDKTTREERQKIFPHLKKSRKKSAAKSPAPPTFEEIQPAIVEAIQQQGEATTVKMTIIGRPGRVIEKDTLVITSMQSVSPPSLPKGLPKPPGDPAYYVVFIAMKQWRKVKESINKNPEDKLIVEGYPVFAKQLGQSGAMTIYAQSTTTTLIQQARRKASP